MWLSKVNWLNHAKLKSLPAQGVAGSHFFFVALSLANALPTAATRNGGILDWVEAFAYCLVIFGLWVALIGRPWWAVLAGCAGFLWWWPAELYLRWTYAAPVTAEYLGFALGTNRRELLEFIETFWRELTVGLALVTAVAAVSLYLCWRSPVRWQHRSRWWFLILCAVLGLGLHQAFEQLEPDWNRPNPDPFHTIPSQSEPGTWRKIFPMTLPSSLGKYAADSLKIAQLREPLRDFRFGAAKAGQPLDTVVLVIGESSRADRWSLGGYSRPTNPLLGKRANLIFFSNAVSLSTATRFAVPAIVSRRPILRADGQFQQKIEPSIVAAFGEAGYRTAWFSTQAPSGFWDGSSAFYAQDAQVVRFVNLSTVEHDEALLGPFKDFVDQGGGPAMIVLHTLGSHFQYTKRYPPAFARFGSDAGEQPVSSGDAYDNSILYTDYFLDSVMRHLESRGRRAVVFYISDHGEDVAGSGTCPKLGSTRLGAGSYRVPALVWMSDSLARDRQRELELLRSRAAVPWNSSETFPTLLQLGGVQLPEVDAGLLSARRIGSPRMVAVGSRWVDFDRAERRDPCRIGSQ